MATPVITPEQRAAGLEKAARVRRERAAVSARIKAGTLTVADVVADPGGPGGGMRVSALLRALPGVGPVRAAEVMERIGIDGARRVRGLGACQRAALESEFAA